MSSGKTPHYKAVSNTRRYLVTIVDSGTQSLSENPRVTLETDPTLTARHSHQWAGPWPRLTTVEELPLLLKSYTGRTRHWPICHL